MTSESAGLRGRKRGKRVRRKLNWRRTGYGNELTAAFKKGFVSLSFSVVSATENGDEPKIRAGRDCQVTR